MRNSMYSIMVKIEGFENRRRNAGLLHIILGSYLILKAFDFYNLSATPNVFTVLPVLVVAAASLYYGLFRKRIDAFGKNNLALRIIQAITFVVFGFTMMKVGRPIDYYGLFLWAVLTVLLMISERKAYNDTVIYLQNTGIEIPGYYKNHVVRWSEVEDVVIRHDFITIFHTGKKYLQFQVMQTLSELELAKMNAFCRERIEEKNVVNPES